MTAPSLSEIVRASSIIEAWERVAPDIHPPFLAAAQTMSAAYHELLVRGDASSTVTPLFADPCWFDSDPTPPHGIVRPEVDEWRLNWPVIAVLAATIVIDVFVVLSIWKAWL